jgi:mono/diheme cytochrome c family protein
MGLFVVCLLPKPLNSVYASSRNEQETGSVLYHEKGCEYCHGVNGAGTDKAPYLSNIGKIWKKPRIKQQILDGGHEMPPFRDALTPDEVTALVNYLSAKRDARHNR